MLQNKNNELLTVSPTSKEVQAYASGRQTINVTASTTWEVSTKQGPITEYSNTNGVGNGSFSFQFGQNNTFNDIQRIIQVKDVFYNRLNYLYPNDTSTLSKHNKTIQFTQKAKKVLSLTGGTIEDQNWDSTSVNIKLNSSFNISSNNGITLDDDTWCSAGVVTRNYTNETLSFTVTMSQNTSTQSNRTVNITVKTEDQQELTFSITQNKKPEN